MEVFHISISLATCIATLAVIVLTYIYLTWTHDFWKKRGIPGPRPIPVFGTAYLIFTRKNKAVLHHDLNMIGKYGKVFGEYLGRKPVLVVADRAKLRQIMVKEFGSFVNRGDFGEGVSANEYPINKMLTVLKDEEWKRVRNTLTPAFSANKFRAMVPQVNQCADLLIENFEVFKGREANIKNLTDAYTFDVIARVGFGVELDSQKDPENVFIKNARKFTDFQITLKSGFLLLALFVPKLYSALKARFPDTVYVFSREALKFFTNLVRKIISEREGDNKERNRDLVHLMMEAHNLEQKSTDMDHEIGRFTDKDIPTKGLSEDEVLAQSVLLLLAGFDTTSTTLSFLMYNFALNPECMNKAQMEIDEVFQNKATVSYEITHELPYLDMCISESLRLFPPAVRADRKCVKGVTVDGLLIPKDINVVIPISALHRDPEVWPQPEEFRPERFSPEAKAERDTFSYMPFGMGPRNCIGMRLAQLELRIAMVKILQKFDIKTCEKTEIPVKLTTGGLLKPKNGIFLKLDPRQ